MENLPISLIRSRTIERCSMQILQAIRRYRSKGSNGLKSSFNCKRDVVRYSISENCDDWYGNVRALITIDFHHLGGQQSINGPRRAEGCNERAKKKPDLLGLLVKNFPKVYLSVWWYLSGVGGSHANYDFTSQPCHIHTFILQSKLPPL